MLYLVRCWKSLTWGNAAGTTGHGVICWGGWWVGSRVWHAWWMRAILFICSKCLHRFRYRLSRMSMTLLQLSIVTAKHCKHPFKHPHCPSHPQRELQPRQTLTLHTNIYRDTAKGWLGRVSFTTLLNFHLFFDTDIFSITGKWNFKPSSIQTTLPPPRHSFVDILVSPLCFCFASRRVSNIFNSCLVLSTKEKKAWYPASLILPACTIALVDKMIFDRHHSLPATQLHVIKFIPLLYHNPAFFHNKKDPLPIKHENILLSTLRRPYSILYMNLFSLMTP